MEFGSSKAAPWRAGANESTTIEFSTDVNIEGQPLAAGKYGFFVAYGKEYCTLIFNKDNTSWGSYYYDPSKDVLQVKVKSVETSQSAEWLKYEFTNQLENKATITLFWEKLAIPFIVEVDLLKTQIASFRSELRTDNGFYWLSWQTAAQWCVDHNTNLEEALQWADSATHPAVGEINFVSLSTKAQVLTKLGRSSEAATIMQQAIPLGNLNQLHQYAKQLLAQKEGKLALEVFKINFEKNPNQFTTLIGLARGYSAVGEYKKALEFAQKAVPLSPNALNKQSVEKMIQLLKEGKYVN